MWRAPVILERDGRDIMSHSFRKSEMLYINRQKMWFPYFERRNDELIINKFIVYDRIWVWELSIYLHTFSVKVEGN